MLVGIPVAVLLVFAARLRRRWDYDRYREEMLFEAELHRRRAASNGAEAAAPQNVHAQQSNLETHERE